jgi:ATP-dependent RNA helicase DeaD
LLFRLLTHAYAPPSLIDRGEHHPQEESEMLEDTPQVPLRLDPASSPFEAFEMSTSVPVTEPVELSPGESFDTVVGDLLIAETPGNSGPILCQQDAFDPTPVAAAPTVEAKPEPEPEPVKTPGEVTFLDLPLRSEVQQAVQTAGYEKPTAIQAEIIPHMLEGRDVLAQSQTGTGKTAAFALPILSRIEIGRKKPQVLVLTPTRELAIQVARSFSTYGSSLPRFSVAAIYGGQDYTAQFRQLKDGVEVVVGTPGRVIDHIKRGTLDLSAIDCLVLDEADEMLNMGFLEDVQFVLEHAPEKRQIALFSATLPTPIRNIAKRYLNDPARITIQTKTMTTESTRQRALFILPRDKTDVLKRLLEVEETDGVIVFTNTKDASVRVAEQLNREGLSAVALNGDMPQKVRERTIEQLKAGHLDILVATDVAARGLDVTRVSHVFNYDVPQDGESYIHRVGRTGRAGRKGEAIIFLTNAQRGKLRFIERATKQPIEIIQPPTADEINATRVKRFTQRIAAMTADQDLMMFQRLITEFAEESGTPMVLIAAALAQINQQGRPFLMKERPRRKTEQKGQRYGQSDSGSSVGRARRGGEGRGDGRQQGTSEPGKDRYRIEVGWNDGVKPGNIVGAIANEGGISGEHIGPIKIHDAYSTVDLPAGMPVEILQTLQQTKVTGKQLQLRLANETGGGSIRPQPERGPRSDQPRQTHGHASKGPGRSKPFQNKKSKKRKAQAQLQQQVKAPTVGSSGTP